MREHETVGEVVDRIVRESNIPGARESEDLRRELMAHFEEAGDSPEAIRGALERFGNTTDIVAGLRRAHSRGRIVLYAAKVLASVAVSAAVALGVQAVMNLRLEPVSGALRLGPWYGMAALISIILVVAAAVAWELGIDSLCARLERRPVRLCVVFVTFTTGAYLTHLMVDRMVEPEAAIIGSAATLAVWISSIAILSRFELAFIRRFGATK